MDYVCFVLFDCCLVVWFDFGLVVGCFVLVIDLICWFAEVCISSVVWVPGGWLAAGLLSLGCLIM